MDEAYRDCRLCPRDCGVDRTAGAAGRCGESASLRVASILAHYGEEPVLSGTRGSGTVFFSGCSSGCFFCQNYRVSLQHAGRVMDDAELEREVAALVARGVHNVNFVTPDHFWPHVERLGAALRARGCKVPFVFNGSGYQRPDMLPRYAAVMDVFLPDFKFADAGLARRVMGDGRYPAIALAALEGMVAAKGFCEPWDPSGGRPARRGVLVRHLVLPGETANSVGVLRLLREAFGRHLPLSVMGQYRPVPACRRRSDLDRRVTSAEYRAVCDEAAALGFENLFVQALSGDDGFLPDFDREEPFAGNRPRPPPGG